ncbi:MAG: helix-turn-helix domain-containing protein [Verrucomicrobia bacterium]|nr:helix-turn-helix domain-containing protein [Verrucomicrobiota bacterium]
MALHPTLWRTCRVLAGETRIRLLRLVVNNPGRTVSDLAATIGISLPRASQELRRLQSRGLLQAVRVGRQVRYQPIPDPQVPSAKPLLKAAETVFRRFPREAETRLAEIATAFSHPRRIAIVRELLWAPQDTLSLLNGVGIPRISLNRHLRLLRARGLVEHRGGKNRLTASHHPLVQCLARMIKQSSAGG